MNTKDIEEIVSKVLTGYPRLPHEQKELQKELIQAFTQRHEAEVERRVEAERERVVEIIKDKGCTHKLYYSKDNIVPCYTKEVVSILDAVTPTTPDKQ